MANQREGTGGTPSVRALVRSAWNTALTVYYANSASWRVLKAGALLFFGFFAWAGSNVLLSYRGGWTPLQYTAAYGALLVVYGPVHHVVVIPLALRWRRTSGTRQAIGRRLPTAGLAVFLAAVVVLGTFPAFPVTADLGSSLGDGSLDVDPDLDCVRHVAENGTSRVHCHLSESRGVDHVVVSSDGRELVADATPPFEFTVHGDELDAVAGERRLQIDLRDAEGELVRRYTRTVSQIPAAE